jgi:hypothetical protein
LICRVVPGASLVAIAVVFALPCGLAAEPYSPEPPPRPRVLFDYHHRLKPRTQIGEHLVTGGWTDSIGRYRINDMPHTNSYDSLFHALEREFALVVHESPLTPQVLTQADILVIVNPEDPADAPGVPTLCADEIENVVRFVQRGGSLLIMINAVGASAESFERVQLRKLVNRFGLDWNEDDTRYSNIPVGPRHPFFYDLDVFHYGSGCTLKFLPHAQSPQVLLEVREDHGSPKVRGPGLVKVRSGKGKVMLVGDAGSWGGGNMSRPWVENTRFAVQMFRYLRRDTDVLPIRYPEDQSMDYDFRTSQLNVLAAMNALAQTDQPGSRIFQPRPRTRIPYAEAAGAVQLVCRPAASEPDVREFTATIGELRRFGEPVEVPAGDRITLWTNRQGSLIEVRAHGTTARTMAPDAAALVGFIPNATIRIGDRWEKLQSVRVNPIRGAEPASTRVALAEMVYLKDETVAGRDCRVIRSQLEEWLPDLHIRIEDLLPLEDARGLGGARFELMSGRGGKLLYRREQWLDRETGVVVKAVTQSRILLWIRELGKTIPVTNADKDNSMVCSLAHIAEFTLRPGL